MLGGRSQCKTCICGTEEQTKKNGKPAQGTIREQTILDERVCILTPELLATQIII